MDYWYLSSIFRLFLTGVTIGYCPSRAEGALAGMAAASAVAGLLEAAALVALAVDVNIIVTPPRIFP
jgi:hypothetical protein